jgi:hypothetical protein
MRVAVERVAGTNTATDDGYVRAITRTTVITASTTLR